MKHSLRSWTSLIIFVCSVSLFFGPGRSYANDSLQAPLSGINDLMSKGKFREVISSIDRYPKQDIAKTDGGIKYQIATARIKALIGLSKLHEALKEINEIRSVLPESEAEKNAWLNNLSGVVFTMTGSYEKANEYLLKAYEFSKGPQYESLAATVLLNLSVLAERRKQEKEAMEYLGRASDLSERTGDAVLKYKILIQIAALSASSEPDGSIKHLSEVLNLLTGLSDSYDKARCFLKAGEVFQQLAGAGPAQKKEFSLKARQCYEEASKVALAIENPGLFSLASGNIGHIDEEDMALADALTHTRAALLAAQELNQPGMLYKWQWQLSRILKSQGKIDDAVSMNRFAIKSLQTMRADIGARDVEYFSRQVKPVYMDMADLLLRQATSADAASSQKILSETLDTIELLRSDELRNYLRDSCVSVKKEKIIGNQSALKDAAVIYYIVFSDRIDVIVSTSKYGLRQFVVPQSIAAVSAEVEKLRSSIENISNDYMESSNRLYDWLIRPLEGYLSECRTLVFVPDGILRTVPMAALHDGKKFLVEKHAIAMTQGLTITEGTYRESFKNLNILEGGISKSVHGYDELPYVSKELERIGLMYQGKVLKDEAFAIPNIQKELKKTAFPVIHIASHGQFAGNVDDTYILTWDGKMTIDMLDHFVKMSQSGHEGLDLLTLSACSTAAGDDRASLGLAGIALKAGAKSAIASLWDISDMATSEFFVKFYDILKNDPKLSKSEALQAAQIAMLKGNLKPSGDKSPSRSIRIRPVERAEQISVADYSHPFYWAPFILTGNWQ